jgi:eukaryotic-like serine/threonine-protein kinase
MASSSALPERVRHYRVLERIGRGGMGEIYTAHDERLDRIVVLKVISPDRLGNASARTRFVREARAAASLSHPFICAIYEVIETDAGEPVIVMEYVRGATVMQRTASGPLEAADVYRFGREMAEALAAAHAQGIVHRDVSAANVMIADDGHVKLMDFGLAHVQRQASGVDEVTITAAVSVANAIAGTPGYVAPEILGGAAADARSDLYGAGVVLYRMAAGRLPFSDAGATGLADVLTRAPVPPRAFVPSLPWALERVILRLLEKEPAARFDSAGALASALADAGGGRADATGPLRVVAVLPFKPLGRSAADPELGIGLADATITDLASVRALLVRPTSSILAYEQRAVDAATAGRELSADAVVVGSFQRAGHRIRVTVQLVRTADGHPIWGTKIDTSFDDVFRLQDEVSRRIVEALEVQLTERDQERLERAGRAGSPARSHYMRGRVLMLRETIESCNAAVEAFEEALHVDPSFAPAYAGLASAYLRIAFTFFPEGDYHARAVEMCERALALDPQLPEALFVRGRLAWTPQSGFNHAEAVKNIAAAIAARPNLNEAIANLGMILFHLSLFEESIALLERSVAIDPRDSYAFGHFGYCWYLQGQWERGHRYALEHWERTPTTWAGYQLALLELHLDRRDDAARTIDKAARQFPGDVLFYPLAAVRAALGGDAAGVRKQVELTQKHHKDFGHYHHAQYDVACALALIGERDAALEWLGQAAANGFPCYAFFEIDPWLEALRPDPRFTELMARLRAECATYQVLYRDIVSDQRLTPRPDA